MNVVQRTAGNVAGGRAHHVGVLDVGAEDALAQAIQLAAVVRAVLDHLDRHHGALPAPCTPAQTQSSGLSPNCISAVNSILDAMHNSRGMMFMLSHRVQERASYCSSWSGMRGKGSAFTLVDLAKGTPAQHCANLQCSMPTGPASRCMTLVTCSAVPQLVVVAVWAAVHQAEPGHYGMLQAPLRDCHRHAAEEGSAHHANNEGQGSRVSRR